LFCLDNVLHVWYTKLQLRCHCCLPINHLQSHLHKLQSSSRKKLYNPVGQTLYTSSYTRVKLLAPPVHTLVRLVIWLRDSRLADNLQGKQSASTANVKQMWTCLLDGSNAITFKAYSS
jgi:hypothetical protein